MASSRLTMAVIVLGSGVAGHQWKSMEGEKTNAMVQNINNVGALLLSACHAGYAGSGMERVSYRGY